MRFELTLIINPEFDVSKRKSALATELLLLSKAIEEDQAIAKIIERQSGTQPIRCPWGDVTGYAIATPTKPTRYR